jgi:multidrug efflux pump subunit AcrA (membrane-fusion protein)
MNAQSRQHRARFLLVPLVLAAGIAWWYLSIGQPATPRDEVVRTVRVARPDRSDMEERFSVRSFVEADQTVTILPLVSGTIEQLSVDVGDPVRTDGVIARIDPAQYELALTQANASFAAAEGTFERTRRLYEANATPVQNYDHARAQYEAARSRRDLAQLRLGYTTVRSPVDGVVLVRHVAGGDIASPERPIVTVGDIPERFEQSAPTFPPRRARLKWCAPLLATLSR